MHEDVPEICKKLESWANWVASRFGWPVYLVGSALDKGLVARDIDVVVILPYAEFEGRYGYEANRYRERPWDDRSLRWGNDVAKITQWSGRDTQLNLDFKIQPSYMISHHRLLGKSRIRIDKLDLEEVKEE